LRSPSPNETYATYDLSYIISVCNTYPGEQAYTLSYTDAAMPQYTFITMMNCVARSTPDAFGNLFSFYYAVDLTAGTISEFLKNSTATIHGSKGFIVETETELLIACKYFPITVLTFDSGYRQICDISMG